jgi:phospholipase C
VLQFLEVFLARKASSPIEEPNISAWRRTVCGDLTSAFRPHDGKKDVNPMPVARDPFVEQIHRAKFNGPPSSYKSLTADEIQQICENTQASPLLPQQESGTRPSRALPYELHSEGRLNRDAETFTIAFEAAATTFGRKAAGAPFHVYAPGGYRPDDAASYTDAPFNYEHARRWAFAVAAGDKIEYAWPVDAFEDGLYHLRTYGPNGFHREYRGNASDPMLEIVCSYTNRPDASLVLTLSNRDTSNPVKITVSDIAYGGDPMVRTLPPGGTLDLPVDLTRSFRWYDLGITVEGSPLFRRRYAGRVETGEDGQSDPLIGRRATITAGRDHTETSPVQRKN